MTCSTTRRYLHGAVYHIAGGALYQCTRRRRWMHWHTGTYVRFGLRIDPCYHQHSSLLPRLVDNAVTHCLCNRASPRRETCYQAHGSRMQSHSLPAAMHVLHVRFPTSLPSPHPEYTMHGTRRYFPFSHNASPLISTDQLRLLGDTRSPTYFKMDENCWRCHDVCIGNRLRYTTPHPCSLPTRICSPRIVRLPNGNRLACNSPIGTRKAGRPCTALLVQQPVPDATANRPTFRARSNCRTGRET